MVKSVGRTSMRNNLKLLAITNNLKRVILCVNVITVVKRVWVGNQFGGDMISKLACRWQHISVARTSRTVLRTTELPSVEENGKTTACSCSWLLPLFLLLPVSVLSQWFFDLSPCTRLFTISEAPHAIMGLTIPLYIQVIRMAPNYFASFGMTSVCPFTFVCLTSGSLGFFGEADNFCLLWLHP